MNPWYVNPLDPQSVELFEVTDVAQSEKYVTFSRIYSDGTAAPLQQVDLQAQGMAPAIFETKNEAIGYAIENLAAAEQDLQAQIEAVTDEIARLQGMITVAPAP